MDGTATDEDEENGHILGGAYPSDGGRLSPALNLVYFRGEPPVFSVTGGAASENDGPLEFTVTLSESPSPQATVNYATSDGAALEGQDYTRTSDILTFDAGETSKTVRVPLLDDRLDEETFTLTLSEPHRGELKAARSSAVGTISDDEPAAVDYYHERWGREGRRGEHGRPRPVPHRRRQRRKRRHSHRKRAHGERGLDHRALRGTGRGHHRGGLHRRQRNADLHPGVRQQRICIIIADDGEAEAAEKYRIEFSNASGAQLPDPASVVGTILDDDNPGVTVWPTALTVPEGSESDYTVRLTAPPETGVAVTLAMNAPADAEKLETSDGCCEPSGSSCSYSVAEMDLMPEGVVSFGCGNPVALSSLRVGDTVLDLGSGAGMDCFLAAREVGANGSVIGVDFTPAMIERAEENAAKLGLENVSFRLGDIETLPIDDSSVDVVMSNCVINLAPDKDAVFAEAFRALSPGGRLAVSDIVLTRPATTEEKENMALLTGCVSGSLPVDEYLEKVRHAGFQYVEYTGVAPASGDQFWFSAAISGRKPV